MHPCPGNWLAIGCAVVYYARLPTYLVQELKCRHCTFTKNRKKQDSVIAGQSPPLGSISSMRVLNKPCFHQTSINLIIRTDRCWRQYHASLYTSIVTKPLKLLANMPQSRKHFETAEHLRYTRKKSCQS